MRSGRIAAVALLAGLSSSVSGVALAVTLGERTIVQPAQGRGGGEPGSSKTGVSELWKLYPIDPASKGTPLPTPTIDVGYAPTKKTPAPSEPAVSGGSSSASDASESGSGRWLIGGAVAIVAAGAAIALVVVRRSGGLPHPAQVASMPASRARGDRPVGRLPVGRPRPRNNGGPPAREHVRVHLHDGRRIEGWRKRGPVAEDNRVLVLDVDGVYDSAGRALATTPLDSFVLPPQIDRIEKLE
jgi:hypothetical protein